ncbi:cytochrome oxidase c subunit VIb-domain-containing protein, partial [Cercophora samala]
VPAGKSPSLNLQSQIPKSPSSPAHQRPPLQLTPPPPPTSPFPSEKRKETATMGWLSSSSPEDQRSQEIRAGTVAPSRAERARCWEARDGYFACLDRNNIVDALKEEKAAGKACGAESKVFEKDCAAQWVTYFKKWRVQDIQKRQRIKELEAQGANRLDVQTDFTPRS